MYQRGFGKQTGYSENGGFKSREDKFFIKDIKREQLFVDLRNVFTEYGLNITESETIIDRVKRYLDKIQK